MQKKQHHGPLTVNTINLHKYNEYDKQPNIKLRSIKSLSKQDKLAKKLMIIENGLIANYYIMIKQNSLIVTELRICSWISSISQLDFSHPPITVVVTSLTFIIPIHYKLDHVTKVILCNRVICEFCMTGRTIRP